MPAVIFDLDDTLYPHVQHVHSGFCRRRDVRRSPLRACRRRIVYAHASGCARAGLSRRTNFSGSVQVVSASNEAIVPDLRRRSYAVIAAALAHARRLGGACMLCAMRGWRTALLTNGDPSVQAAQGPRARARRRSSITWSTPTSTPPAASRRANHSSKCSVVWRLRPQNAVMVGDDPVNDIEGARAVGMRDDPSRAAMAAHGSTTAVPTPSFTS